VIHCSNNLPTKKRHNLLLCPQSAEVGARVGGACAGLHRLRCSSAAQRAPGFLTPSGLRHLRAAALRLSIAVFSFRLTPAPSSPRARFPGNPQAGSPMLSLLTAPPRYPSAAAFSSNEHHASTWSALPKVPVPSTRPPGGFPQPPAARLPRASRRSRAAVARKPMHRQHRATVPVAILPAQRLCENQAARPRPDKGHARPSYRRPRHPVLLGLAPSAGS